MPKVNPNAGSMSVSSDRLAVSPGGPARGPGVGGGGGGGVGGRPKVNPNAGSMSVSSDRLAMSTGCPASEPEIRREADSSDERQMRPRPTPNRSVGWHASAGPTAQAA